MKKHTAETKKNTRVSEIIEVLKRSDIVHGLNPQKLKSILEELGPTFIKLGQIMSMRPDLIPQAYCDELAGLQSSVTPMDFSEVRQVIQKEYGVPYKDVFANVDPIPLGSASIAQVHRARLKDGQEIVIKVQRLGIEETMGRDIAILRKAIGIMNLVSQAGDAFDFKIMIEEMWIVAQQEMDFLIEASHLEEFARLNSEIQYVDCPIVNRHLTTAHILVMEYVNGIPIDQKGVLIENGYDLDEIGAKLAESYAKQVLDDAFFHADPHPGNICIREGKIIWLDLGMMGRLTARDKQLFRSAVSAIAAGDIYELKNAVLSIGVVREKINHAALYNDIDLMLAKYGHVDFSNIDLGQVIVDLTNISNTHHIGMPEGVSMLGRGVMTIEGVLSTLSPQINFVTILSNHMRGNGLNDIDWQGELTELVVNALHSFKKALDIPSAAADILKMTVKGQTKVNLELTGSEEPLSKLDMMMDKLIIAIITAALLVGSSLICTTDMAGRLFGIPVLGAVGFLLAILLGAWLLYGIIKKK